MKGNAKSKNGCHSERSEESHPFQLKTQNSKLKTLPCAFVPLCLCACLLLAGCSGGGGGGADGAVVTGTGKLQVTSYESSTVAVTSAVSGATITLDGADTGKTTPVTLEVAPGTHTLKITLPGRLWEGEVVVKSNQTVIVDAVLTYTYNPPGLPKIQR